MKAVISCTVLERESTTCAVDSGFFLCPYVNRPSCRTHNGTGWGTACSVGRYETQARAAKLVPFIERLAGVVAPESITEGALRRLGASTKKQWGICRVGNQKKDCI